MEPRIGVTQGKLCDRLAQIVEWTYENRLDAAEYFKSQRNRTALRKGEITANGTQHENGPDPKLFLSEFEQTQIHSSPF
jgi:hypothetical protein